MDQFEKASDAIEKDRDYNSNNENVIEFLRGAKTATVCFTQGRYISKIKKLAEKFPDEVIITSQNKDGSIVAHIPVKYIHISRPGKGRVLTEEEKEAAKERLKAYRESKKAGD